MIDKQQSVAHIVLNHSECAAIFQRHRIDYCCHGDQTVEEACERRGLDADALVAELSEAIAARGDSGGTDLRELSTEALIDHIVSTHHRYLRETLPFLQPLATRVGRVHGGENPRLRELDQIVAALAEALIPHLDAEEQTLFPALLADQADSQLIAREIAAMDEEHQEVAVLLERMRDATEDFRLPDRACNSYRTLFAELERLEADILKHVHTETHVLKPRFASA